MRIKFKSPDPRAGMVAQMDSGRGRDLVASGAADEIGEDGTDQAQASPGAQTEPKQAGKAPRARKAAPDGGTAHKETT